MVAQVKLVWNCMKKLFKEEESLWVEFEVLLFLSVFIILCFCWMILCSVRSLINLTLNKLIMKQVKISNSTNLIFGFHLLSIWQTSSFNQLRKLQIIKVWGLIQVIGFNQKWFQFLLLSVDLLSGLRSFELKSIDWVVVDWGTVLVYLSCSVTDWISCAHFSLTFTIFYKEFEIFSENPSSSLPSWIIYCVASNVICTIWLNASLWSYDSLFSLDS